VPEQPRPRHRWERLWEVGLVWLLFGLTAVAVFETYWRLPPSQLWKVTNSGFVGGAGRAFVFLSYSAALAAAAVLAIVVDRLDDRRATVAGVAAFLLCATVAVPGVQTPSHLDPKWANVPAVVGVFLAVALSAWAMRRGRAERSRASPAGDRARVVAAAILLVAAAPYIAAELGFFLDGVPVLGWVFQTGRIRPEPGSGVLHAAVHHGHHHGLDGLLLAISVLLLSRLTGTIRRPSLREATAAYLSLMLVYGLTNMANDLWTEQIVKRGWTAWEIPDVLEPSASAAWAAMIAVAAVFYLALFRPRSSPPPQRRGKVVVDVAGE
jgi:protein-S-isoprenylcysteine O-methyltransferase Ste14